MGSPHLQVCHLCDKISCVLAGSAQLYILPFTFRLNIRNVTPSVASAAVGKRQLEFIKFNTQTTTCWNTVWLGGLCCAVVCAIVIYIIWVFWRKFRSYGVLRKFCSCDSKTGSAGPAWHVHKIFSTWLFARNACYYVLFFNQYSLNCNTAVAHIFVTKVWGRDILSVKTVGGCGTSLMVLLMSTTTVQTISHCDASEDMLFFSD